MNKIKILLIAIAFIISSLATVDALNWDYKGFAYWNSDKVIFIWSEYDSNEYYNNFKYYKVIRTNLKTNKSTTLSTVYNKRDRKYTDNNPLQGQWSLYKTCSYTITWRTFCTIPHKIYISYANNSSSTSNTNYNNSTYTNNYENNHYGITNKSITYSSHNYKNYYPYGDDACPAHEQPAKNPKTWVCRVYSNPCNVPAGWKNVATCDVENNELSVSMKRRLKTIITRFVDKVVKKDIEDYKKLEILKRSITRFKSVKTIEWTRLSYVASYSITILEDEYARYKRDYSLDTGIYYQFNEFLDWSY